MTTSIAAKANLDRTSELSIAVVYHSNYGHTKRVAQAIATGARQQLAETQVKAIDVHEVDWDFLDRSS